MRRSLTLILVLAAMASAAACGGKSGTPATPAAPSTTNTGTPAGPSTPGPTATVTGNVQGAPTGVTVSVVGTSISAVVDGASHFVLLNVPPGEVQLQLTGGGANATVSLGAVEPSQTVDLVVTVAGSSASIDSQVKSGAGEAELEGRVESLPPTTLPLTFKAAGRTVRTDSTTQFVDGNVTRAFGDLQIGTRVHVKGTLSGDALTATVVELQAAPSPPAPTPPVPTPPVPTPPVPTPPVPTPPVPNPPVENHDQAEVNGVVDTLSGSASAFQFKIGTRLVKGDLATAFFGDGDKPDTFSDLKNGARVEVKGQERDGIVQATRIHINEPDDAPAPTPAPATEVEMEGPVGGLKGTCPSLTFGVKGTSVTTSASTAFEGGLCTALKNGDKVTVKGAVKADGSVAAVQVTKK